MPEWPLWLRNLWLGQPGQAYGEEGLMRSAARKFARQINNGLSLASQVSGVDQIVNDQLFSLWLAPFLCDDWPCVLNVHVCWLAGSAASIPAGVQFAGSLSI